MADRITEKDLGRIIDGFNQGKPDGVLTGRYALDYAYGGVKLVRYVNEGRGQEDISPGGYGTKRELYTFMRGMQHSNGE